MRPWCGACFRVGGWGNPGRAPGRVLLWRFLGEGHMAVAQVLLKGVPGRRREESGQETLVRGGLIVAKQAPGRVWGANGRGAYARPGMERVLESEVGATHAGSGTGSVGLFAGGITAGARTSGGKLEGLLLRRVRGRSISR